MSKITYSITFKDGSRVDQQSTFGHDARSEFFLGLSQGFKNNADIEINNNVKKKFDDVKAIEIKLD